MGKGIIISGGADGQYQVEVNFYREKINAEIASLEVRIAALGDQIALLPLGLKRDVVRLQKTALEKRKDFLENNVPEDETISAWCADFSEKLTGNVGTVEVPGERGTVLIQPGFEDNAVYSQSRDGQLLSAVGASPEQYFYNLAMLPGWQKWKPTFRFGVIDSRDGDTANVTLEAATSSQQSIDVNQTTELTGVPIEYMACNGGVFEPGDAVLIMFENQDWETPKIIGFKDNPKQCFPYLVVRLEYTDYGEWGDNVSFVWDIEENDFATNIPDGSGGFVDMPCEYADLSYWLFETYDATEKVQWIAQEIPSTWRELQYPDGLPFTVSETSDTGYYHSGSYRDEYKYPTPYYCDSMDSFISWDRLSTASWSPVSWNPPAPPVVYPRERFGSSRYFDKLNYDWYGAVINESLAFCLISKIDDSLDFKVHISESLERSESTDLSYDYHITETKDISGFLPFVMHDKVISNIVRTDVYRETRNVVLNSPLGEFPLLNRTSDAEINYTISSADLAIAHTKTTLCQIYLTDIDIFNKESPDERLVKVVCSIGIEEDGIIDGQYDPKTGEVNTEMADSIEKIILERAGNVRNTFIRFRM